MADPSCQLLVESAQLAELADLAQSAAPAKITARLVGKLFSSTEHRQMEIHGMRHFRVNGVEVAGFSP